VSVNTTEENNNRHVLKYWDIQNYSHNALHSLQVTLNILKRKLRCKATRGGSVVLDSGTTGRVVEVWTEVQATLNTQQRQSVQPATGALSQLNCS
jgi:hypothetical protein